MKTKITSIAILFGLAVYAGYGMIPIESVQSKEIIPVPQDFSKVYLPPLTKIEDPTSKVDIEINLETMETNVTSDKDVNVKLTTVGEQKPTVKYVTKTVIKEIESKTGYPYVKNLRNIPDSLAIPGSVLTLVCK